MRFISSLMEVITHKSRFALFHPEGMVAYQFRFAATSENVALFNRYFLRFLKIIFREHIASFENCNEGT